MALDVKAIKELRERTAAGMMDAKNALEANDGDIEKAIDWLREKGIAKAVKKAGRIAAEGSTTVKIAGEFAVVCEVNSETDFVSMNVQFKSLVDEIADILLTHKPKDVEAALQIEVKPGQTLDTMIAEATSTIGEKIVLRRFEIVEKNNTEIFGDYIHMGGKVTALVVITGENKEVARDVAMQVAALNPQFLSREEVPQAFIDKEKALLMQQAKDEGLAEKMIDKIVEGRLSKQLKEVCLLEQAFVKENKLSVKQYVNQHQSQVLKMVRYAVGEGIEKKQENFAEEVMSQIKK